MYNLISQINYAAMNSDVKWLKALQQSNHPLLNRETRQYLADVLSMLE